MFRAAQGSRALVNRNVLQCRYRVLMDCTSSQDAGLQGSSLGRESDW